MKESIVYLLLDNSKPNPLTVIEVFDEMYDRFEGRSDLQRVIYDSRKDFAKRHNIEANLIE